MMHKNRREVSETARTKETATNWKLLNGRIVLLGFTGKSFTYYVTSFDL